jgi:SSS family solute:Na+ symporter
MGRFYGRVGRILTGFCGAIFCAAIVGGQVSAIGFIVQYFLNIPYALGVILGCGAVILYSTIGGVKAVTATDVLQFAVLIIALPMVCNVGISMVGGLSSLLEKIPPSHLSWPQTPAATLNYIFMFITFAIPFLDPSITQRFLMAKSTTQIRNTLCISALIEFPFFICVGMIGLVAVATNPDQEANLAFPNVVNTILPMGLKGFAVAGSLAIVMSTADSYLNSAGITLVHDAFKPLFGHLIANERHELRLTQIVTFILGSLATVVALYFDSIMSIIWFSYHFWAPIIIVPLYAGLLGVKNLSSRCFIAGALSGVCVFVVWYVLLEIPYGVSALIPSMLANFAGLELARRYYRPEVLAIT